MAKNYNSSNQNKADKNSANRNAMDKNLSLIHIQMCIRDSYAVGQFNINNLEWTKSILLTAEECKSPVILGVSEGAGKYMTGRCV